MAVFKSGARIRIPKEGLARDLDTVVKLLSNTEVLVGVPEETTDIRNEDGVEFITNADLALIHNEGAPEANIPARPFMIPGIEAVRNRLTLQLRAAAAAAMTSGDPAVVGQALHKVGITAQLSIQKTINAGIDPPLSEYTLRERARKRKGRVGPGLELLSRSVGNAPSNDFVKPLVDTGDLRNSITYVIRERSERKK